MTPLGLPLLTLALLGAAGDTPSAAPDATPAFAPKSAVALADHTEVRLGEPFVVKITVKHDPAERWALAPDQGYAPFSLKSQSRKETRDGALAVDEISLTLALFKLDSQPIPDLKLQGTRPAQGAQPTSATFVLPGPVVKGVAPEIAKDKEKRDILGPVAVQVTTLRPLLWAAGALAAALLVFLGIRFWRRRPRHAKEVLVSARPPHEIALEALTALEGQGLPAQGRFKLFHLELSEILRRYLGERYGMYALDMTSAELIEYLGRHPTDGLSLAEISWICGQGDLAKFAKGEPTADDCKQALTLVRQNVLRTRPPEVTPASAGVAQVKKVGT